VIEQSQVANHLRFEHGNIDGKLLDPRLSHHGLRRSDIRWVHDDEQDVSIRLGRQQIEYFLEADPWSIQLNGALEVRLNRLGMSQVSGCKD
jgi:hypothetical protein